MKEIKLQENKLGINIYINDVLDINLIPKEKADSIIKALELEISLKLNLMKRWRNSFIL